MLAFLRSMDWLRVQIASVRSVFVWHCDEYVCGCLLHEHLKVIDWCDTSVDIQINQITTQRRAFTESDWARRRL